MGLNLQAIRLEKVPIECIERFRKQLTLADLQFESNPDLGEEGAIVML